MERPAAFTGIKMTDKYRAYILTVEEPSHPRIANSINQSIHFGCDYKFIKGAKPNEIRLEDYYSKIKNVLFFKRSLSSGEICCYLGHRRVWQEFLEDGIDHALVFEDDFHIDDLENFQMSLKDCLANARDWDIMKFFDYRPKNILFNRRIGGTEIVAYKYPASGAVCYLISRAAAKSMLTRKRFFRPIDEDMAFPWEFDIRVWSVMPNPVSEASGALGGSTLETERVSVKSARNVFRSIWGNFLQIWKKFKSVQFRKKMAIPAD